MIRAIKAVFPSIVAPGGALLMVNVAMYAGLTSFSLRPNQDQRLLPIMTLAFSGVGLGAIIFPRLQAWAAGAAGTVSRRLGQAAVFCYLLLALATVLPGFFHYAFNEPLRYAANLCLGLVLAPRVLAVLFPVPTKISWPVVRLLHRRRFVVLAHPHERGGILAV